MLAAAYLGLTRTAGRSRLDEVLTAPVVRGELVLNVTDRGELKSAKSEQVVCDLEGGGKIATIVPQGTRVKKGQEVVRLDADSIQKSINEQEVKWEQASGKLKVARNELEVQRNKAASEISKADLARTLAVIDLNSYQDQDGEYQVELDKREAALKLAKKDEKEAQDTLDFTRGLVKKGFAQMESLRAMEYNFEAKQFSTRQLSADLKMLTKFTKLKKVTELSAKSEDALRELERTRKSQAAATEKAENELKSTERTETIELRAFERAKKQLDKTVIRAPADGIVIYFTRPWDEESRVRAGGPVFYQQPIFSLPDLDHMKVEMKVHESVIKKILVGQSVTMTVDALPNQLLHGKVIEVATLASSDGFWSRGVKEYETQVSIDDLPRDAGLRPGMTAEVKILIKTIPNALTVPVQAVAEWAGKHYCFVLLDGGVQRREVTVGDSNEQLVQILTGVDEGERVALDARTRAKAELADDKNKPGEKKDGKADDKKDAKTEESPVPVAATTGGGAS